MEFPVRAPVKPYVRVNLLRVETCYKLTGTGRGSYIYTYRPANITSIVNYPKAPKGPELDNRITGIPKS